MMLEVQLLKQFIQVSFSILFLGVVFDKFLGNFLILLN